MYVSICLLKKNSFYLFLVEDDDYQRPAKLDLVVGFLRLLNFMSACGAIFGIVLSMYAQLRYTIDNI